ncbi:MAG: hypothetical protein Q7J26_06165 [Brevundimonas sp.]|nr:hypothetical protein [Brevundimonas sp.]MDO9608090.1 hypothetical protein [Brevundimonas sp.]
MKDGSLPGPRRFIRFKDKVTRLTRGRMRSSPMRTRQIGVVDTSVAV